MDESQSLVGKIEYARGVLANVEELIRFMDQKGSFIVAICIFFVSSLFSVLQVYSARAIGVEGYLVFVLALWYLGHTAASIWNAILTAKLRQPRLGNAGTGPALSFPLRILERYQSSSVAYLDGLKRAQPEDLLTDLSEQIVVVSTVYAEKARHLGSAIDQLLQSAIPWFAAVIMVVISLGLPRFAARGYVLLSIGVVLVLVGFLVLRSQQSPVQGRDS
jgi:hypothetical protein